MLLARRFGVEIPVRGEDLNQSKGDADYICTIKRHGVEIEPTERGASQVTNKDRDVDYMDTIKRDRKMMQITK